MIQLTDIETREQWRINRQNNTEIPTLEEVSNFLLEKVKTWEEGGSTVAYAENHESRESRKGIPDQTEYKTLIQGNEREYSAPRREFRKDERNYYKIPRELKCHKCQGNHFMNRCKEFLDMKLHEKKNFMQDRWLCEKCLRKRHRYPCLTRCRICSSDGHNTVFCSAK